MLIVARPSQRSITPRERWMSWIREYVRKISRRQSRPHAMVTPSSSKRYFSVSYLKKAGMNMNGKNGPISADRSVYSSSSLLCGRTMS